MDNSDDFRLVRLASMGLIEDCLYTLVSKKEYTQEQYDRFSLWLDTSATSEMKSRILNVWIKAEESQYEYSGEENSQDEQPRKRRRME